jgi:hypothetical protein
MEHLTQYIRDVQDIVATDKSEASTVDARFTVETKHMIAIVFTIFIGVGMFDSVLRLIAIGLLLQSVTFKIEKVPTVGALVMYILEKKSICDG